MSIRPTTDYLREAIFNILAGVVEGTVVLDLFAGTGSLGLEALSRGAERAVFVDKAPQAIKAVGRNLKTCGLEAKGLTVKRDIFHGLGFLRAMGQMFDLIFIDPPYDRGFGERTLQMLDATSMFSDTAFIVVEHSSTEVLPVKIARLVLDDQRRYGKSLVSFYRPML